MPERLIEERFDALTDAVNAATAQLAEDRRERARVLEAEQERTRWWRVASALALVGSSLGLLGTCEAKNAANKANDALVQFEEDRAARAEVACREANKDRRAFNDLLIDAVTQPRTTPRTEQERARAVEFLERRLRPLRDCSPAGIEDYFAETGGTIPVEVPEVP